LNEKQEVYSRQIVQALPVKLVPRFGSGFSARKLFPMIHFAEIFNDIEIVVGHLTPLLDRELLKQKLHQAVIRTFIFYLLPVLIGAFT